MVKMDDIAELYEKNRREILRHSTKITERVPLLSRARAVKKSKENRDSIITEIKREINTVKMYMGELYTHCTERVREAIDGLSEKGTLLCGIDDEDLFVKNSSAILRWASLVNDLRLDVKKSRLDFLSGFKINLSLIHIDLGPSAVKVGV